MVRKKETILSPLEYYRILSEHGTVQKLEDWFLSISNERSESYNLLSKKIEVHSTYSVKPDLVSSLSKRGQHFSKMSEAIPRSLENKVKKDKKADVKKLMAFFEIPEDAKDFYACVLGSVEGVMQDEVDEFDENEPFV